MCVRACARVFGLFVNLAFCVFIYRFVCVFLCVHVSARACSYMSAVVVGGLFLMLALGRHLNYGKPDT